MTPTANIAWVNLLGWIMRWGDHHAPRGQPTTEVIANTTTIDLSRPVVTVPERRIGYRFLAAESAWILSGDNRLSTIRPFAKRIADTCEDGTWFRGAYGPKFVEQIGYVADTLRRDPESRQAMMTLWRERPGATRDVPCTVALQWLIRDGALHCVVTMRSSDAWLGVPYDWHTFAMMTTMLSIVLRPMPLRLGNLHLTAGSQHLYDRDRDNAIRCRDSTSEFPDLAPLDPDEFTDPDDLINHLWAIANGTVIGHRWLADFPGRRIGGARTGE